MSAPASSAESTRWSQPSSQQSSLWGQQDADTIASSDADSISNSRSTNALASEEEGRSQRRHRRGSHRSEEDGGSRKQPATRGSHSTGVRWIFNREPKLCVNTVYMLFLAAGMIVACTAYISGYAASYQHRLFAKGCYRQESLPQSSLQRGGAKHRPLTQPKCRPVQELLPLRLRRLEA
ncbi:hypothetical protein MRX96_039961 [Rhipicephalus microplus]